MASMRFRNHAAGLKGAVLVTALMALTVSSGVPSQGAQSNTEASTTQVDGLVYINNQLSAIGGCGPITLDFTVKPKTGAEFDPENFHLGEISETYIDGCTADFGTQLDVTLNRPAQVYATSSLAGGTGTARIQNTELWVSYRANQASCTFVANGSINIEIDLEANEFVPVAGPTNLVITPVFGNCFGMVAQGANLQIDGVFSID